MNEGFISTKLQSRRLLIKWEDKPRHNSLLQHLIRQIEQNTVCANTCVIVPRLESSATFASRTTSRHVRENRQHVATWLLLLPSPASMFWRGRRPFWFAFQSWKSAWIWIRWRGGDQIRLECDVDDLEFKLTAWLCLYLLKETHVTYAQVQKKSQTLTWINLYKHAHVLYTCTVCAMSLLQQPRRHRSKPKGR